MEAFVQSWQLNVAGGKKRPKLLTVGAPPISEEEAPVVGGEAIRVIQEGETGALLGCPVDPGLTFDQALQQVTARVRREARRVFAGLQSNGFGTPMQGRAWRTRIESAVLPGAEVLASCQQGPRRVMRGGL